MEELLLASKLANSRHVEGLVLDSAARFFRGPRRSLLRRHVGGLGRVLLALLLLLLLPQGHVDKDDLPEEYAGREIWFQLRMHRLLAQPSPGSSIS